MPRRVWQPATHIPQLDGVRGLAILIVTVYRFSKEFPADTFIGEIAHSAMLLGNRGVDLFFVLSGFLITGILLDTKAEKQFFRNFFARRSLRIFPLYFFSLALFLGLLSLAAPGNQLFSAAREQQFFLWSYLTNIQMSLQSAWCFGALDHFWSLAVEEHFYLIWPFVVFLLAPRKLMKVAIALVLLSSGSRVLFAMLSDNGVAPDVFTWFRCDALLIGAIVAIQARSGIGLSAWRWPAMMLFPLCLLIGAGAEIAGKRLFTVPHTVWAVAWAGMLILLLECRQKNWAAVWFEQAWLRKLGKYSYGMYVFQSPLIPICAGVVSVPILQSAIGNGVIAGAAYIAVMFALTLGAALWSWHLLEKHCLRWKRLFEATHDKQSPEKGDQQLSGVVLPRT